MVVDATLQDCAATWARVTGPWVKRCPPTPACNAQSLRGYLWRQQRRRLVVGRQARQERVGGIGAFAIEAACGPLHARPPGAPRRTGASAGSAGAFGVDRSGEGCAEQGRSCEGGGAAGGDQSPQDARFRWVSTDGRCGRFVTSWALLAVVAVWMGCGAVRTEAPQRLNLAPRRSGYL